MNAVIASCSEYTWLTRKKRVDGTLAAQPASCIRMLYFMYLWLPMLISVIITLILSRMNVEEANKRLRDRANARCFLSGQAGQEDAPPREQ